MSNTIEPTNSVVLVGGPDAGKTNYLGRLWMALDAENGAISKNGLPPHIEYLRTIASSLNSGEFAQRTAPSVFESTTIPVKWNGGPLGDLVIPDCAGEQWERIHREREWDSKWESATATMTGCILFYRGTSEHNVPPLNWSEDAALLRCLGPQAGQSNATSADAAPPQLPTQVVLVDWLQCLSDAYRDIRKSDQPLRVSIVLSAWDLAPAEARNADPDRYMEANLPLLYDFLLGNPHLFEPKSFGVSIAGGVLTKDDSPFMRQYLQEDPNSNGYVVFSKDVEVLTSNDLTLPLAWAFGCGCPEFQNGSN